MGYQGLKVVSEFDRICYESSITADCSIRVFLLVILSLLALTYFAYICAVIASFLLLLI